MSSSSAAQGATHCDSILWPAIEGAARPIHAAGQPFVLAITGGGSMAIGWLLGVPGGSRSVLEALVPYSPESLTQLLGARPEHFCAENTARQMAVVAWQRAQNWLAAASTVERDRSDACFGVGCTASLVSDVPKRGPHRVHLAVHGVKTTTTWSLELTKGARNRYQEETLVAALLIELIARQCGVPPEPSLLANLPLLGEEKISRVETDASAEWQQLMSGERAAVLTHADSAVTSGPLPRALFPGAFHPLHDGHRQMAAVAARRLGVPVAFELSIENVDKPPLDFTEIDARRRQFRATAPLWLTRAPTFVRKAEIFPGVIFVVGADTIRRIGDPKYYDGNAEHRDEALRLLAARGCRFLVFGRMIAGRFETLSELDLPPALAALCDEVTESEFRVDLSSTELRSRPEHS